MFSFSWYLYMISFFFTIPPSQRLRGENSTTPGKIQTKNPPSLPSKVNSTQWPMFWSERKYIQTFAFLKFCIVQCICLSISSFLNIYLNFFFTKIAEQKLNKIREIWGCILEALMKNLDFDESFMSMHCICIETHI